MGLLILAILVWLFIHFGISGTRLRDRMVGRIGEQTFRGLFSLLSIAAIVFLIVGWKTAPIIPLWYAPDWLRWILVFVMLPAFVLFVASVGGRNPTMIGGENTVAEAVRGIQRITRHPMLWSFALWAGVHVIGNGNVAAVLFFGTFLVTALAGMPLIDAKLARRNPASWEALSAATSITPFVAIVRRRNRFVPGEIGWLTLLIGVVAWAVLLYFHPWLFGIAPVAM
jgi:uncharacterized membrane protein